MFVDLPLHRPAPGGVGRERQHTPLAELAGHEQRPPVRRHRQRLRGGDQSPQVVRPLERRHAPPGGAGFLVAGSLAEDRDATEALVGHELDRAREMEPWPDRLVERLPRQPVGLEGEQLADDGPAPAARLEGMEAAEKADAGTGVHLGDELAQILGGEGL